MGDVIQLRDYQQPRDLERLRAEQTLEQQAIEIMNVALMGEPGMCGMDHYVVDTSPSELNPYTAPDKDSA